MISSSVRFPEYGPLPYVCARGSCYRICEVETDFRNNCPGNDVCREAVTGATVIMEREAERWNDCFRLNFVSGGVGEPLI